MWNYHGIVVIVYLTFCFENPVLSTLTDIENIVCDGLPYNDASPPHDYYEEHYHYLKDIFKDCHYIRRNLVITQELTKLGPDFDFFFLVNISRVEGQVLLHSGSNGEDLFLYNLVSIGGEKDGKGFDYSLEIRIDPGTYSSISSPGLYALHTVEKGDILIFNYGCAVARLNATRFLRDPAHQSVVLPNTDRCRKVCPGACEGCWGDQHYECQYRSDNCHSSCTNGCFGVASYQCCSDKCSDGCVDTVPNYCLTYSGCPYFSDVNGTCISKCEVRNLGYTNNTQPRVTPGFVLYKKFCLESCPAGAPFGVMSSVPSSGSRVNISVNGGIRWINIVDKGADHWLEVQYGRLILFYYAIIHRMHITGSSLKGIHTYTNGADIWDSVSGIANLSQWEICSYTSNKYIYERVIVRCTFGEEIRLANSLGIKVSSESILSRLKRIETFGMGQNNIALRAQTWSRGTRFEPYGNSHWSVDGVISRNYTHDLTVYPSLFVVNLGKIVQLSHVIIYAVRDYHADEGTRYFINRKILTRISKYNTTSYTLRTKDGWRSCSYLTEDNVVRHCITSCDLLEPKEDHPYIRQFLILVPDTNLRLNEIQIYAYKQKHVGYFTHSHTCVRECPDGYQPDGWRNCTRCDDGVCDKYCDFKSRVIDSHNYMDVEMGCTHLTGDLILQLSDGDAHTRERLNRRLSTIKQISGSLAITGEPGTSPTAFTNLSMFRNLEVILGYGKSRNPFVCPDRISSLCNRNYSLVVDLPNLQYLGIKGPVSIKGDIYLKTSKLCSPSQRNLHLILQTTGRNVTVYNGSLCSPVSMRCHSECAVDCVGTTNSECLPCPPGAPSECRMCKNYQIGRACVPDCGSLDVYEGTNQCGSCHDQCAGGCRGPLPADCQKLRNSCQSSRKSEFTQSKQEQNLYRLNITYDGKGELSWIVEYLPECTAECRIIKGFQLDVGYRNGTTLESKNLASDMRILDLHEYVLNRYNKNTVYTVRLLVNSEGEGLMGEYTPLIVCPPGDEAVHVVVQTGSKDGKVTSNLQIIVIVSVCIALVTGLLAGFGYRHRKQKHKFVADATNMAHADTANMDHAEGYCTIDDVDVGYTKVQSGRRKRPSRRSTRRSSVHPSALKKASLKSHKSFNVLLKQQQRNRAQSIRRANNRHSVQFDKR